mmetsp:Transcript_23379/g.23001  ORF Transcript_23379/g.23001 Transcript_23379/m.23001 type:complete len:92 (+) Transcript_23379:185-460(+)
MAVYFAMIFVTFAWSSRARAFYYLVVFCLITYIQSITKIFYHQPRPYMVDTDIEVYDCSSEMGSPSGHTVIATISISVIFLDIFFSDITVF